MSPRELGVRYEQKLLTLSLSGTWTGTVVLERKVEVPGETYSFTAVDTYTTNQEINIEAPSNHFVYRLNCTVHGSGSIDYALAS